MGKLNDTLFIWFLFGMSLAIISNIIGDLELTINAILMCLVILMIALVED